MRRQVRLEPLLKAKRTLRASRRGKAGTQGPVGVFEAKERHEMAEVNWGEKWGEALERQFKLHEFLVEQSTVYVEYPKDLVEVANAATRAFEVIVTIMNLDTNDSGGEFVFGTGNVN